MPGASSHLDETSGRLATQKTEYDQRLHVEMVFERDRFAQLRNEARIGADQRAASGGSQGEAAVEQALIGTSGGQRFAVGCWHRLAENASGTGLDVNGPYACTLVIEEPEPWRDLGGLFGAPARPPPTRRSTGRGWTGWLP